MCDLKLRKVRSVKRHVEERQHWIQEADRASREWLIKRRRGELKVKLVSLLLICSHSAQYNVLTVEAVFMLLDQHVYNLLE